MAAEEVEEEVLGGVELVKRSYSKTFLSLLVLAVSAFPTEYGWLHQKRNGVKEEEAEEAAFPTANG